LFRLGSNVVEPSGEIWVSSLESLESGDISLGSGGTIS